ncbi:hypothetical protein ACLB1E_30140 [Escherichia coli]
MWHLIKRATAIFDFWIGDAGGPDSNTFLWNNAGTLVGNSTTSNSGGSATVGRGGDGVSFRSTKVLA